jgi:Flp pilus assembly protein TadG
MSERGSATVEFTWLTILLLVPLTYVLLAVFDAQRAAFGVAAASRAAGRAYVVAPSAEVADVEARAAARVALADHHVEAATVTITCTPVCRVPGSTVRVVVRVDQPLPLTPSIFGAQLAPIRLAGVHAEPFGEFREAR